MSRREQVVGYVRKKYGEDRVANIITFGTFGAKMVVRDLARIRDLPFIETNRLAKLVPDDINISLEDALKKSKIQFPISKSSFLSARRETASIWNEDRACR